MPRAPKPLQSLDLHIIDVFENYFREFGVSRNQVVVRAGLGNNRAGKLFRREGPGITAGEIFLLAGALGIPASQIVREAEDFMVAAEFDEERSALIAEKAANEFTESALESMDRARSESKTRVLKVFSNSGASPRRGHVPSLSEIEQSSGNMA